ncbi:hypothetical protein BJ742DRAFT_866587 [Cladochytrium replicatum]|nr:hypothetical protein BJ742DRAFT_866587 [Cladochytrium replicatum]
MAQRWDEMTVPSYPAAWDINFVAKDTSEWEPILSQHSQSIDREGGDFVTFRQRVNRIVKPCRTAASPPVRGRQNEDFIGLDDGDDHTTRLDGNFASFPPYRKRSRELDDEEVGEAHGAQWSNVNNPLPVDEDNPPMPAMVSTTSEVQIAQAASMEWPRNRATSGDGRSVDMYEENGGAVDEDDNSGAPKRRKVGIRQRSRQDTISKVQSEDVVEISDDEDSHGRNCLEARVEGAFRYSQRSPSLVPNDPAGSNQDNEDRDDEVMEIEQGMFINQDDRTLRKYAQAGSNKSQQEYALEVEENQQSVRSIRSYNSKRERRLLISEQIAYAQDEQNYTLIAVDDSEWGDHLHNEDVVSNQNRECMLQQWSTDKENHSGEYPYAEEDFSGDSHENMVAHTYDYPESSPDLQFVEDVVPLPDVDGIATKLTGSDRPLSVHDSSAEPEDEMLAHHRYEGDLSGAGNHNQELLEALARIQELEATVALRDATIEHRERTTQDRLKGMEGALDHFRDECSRLEQVIIDAQNDRDSYLNYARELQAAVEKFEDDLRQTLQELARCKEELEHWKEVARGAEDRAAETAEKTRIIKEKLDSTLGIKEQAFQHIFSFVTGVSEASTALGTLIPPRIHETS